MAITMNHEYDRNRTVLYLLGLLPDDEDEARAVLTKCLDMLPSLHRDVAGSEDEDGAASAG